MKRKIFAAIVALWGLAVVIRGLLAGPTQGTSGAYQSGELTGIIFGALLAVVGAYFFFKKSS